MVMDVVIFLGCAVALAVERVTYWWVWNHPQRFQRFVEKGPELLSHQPVIALSRLFGLFKLVQVLAFACWCMWFQGTWIPTPVSSGVSAAVGALLVVGGQLLNTAVFWRLGRRGVFYGDRLGRPIPWQTGFPFSLVPHPQYVGAAVTVWGLFVLMRYPEPDWIWLPALSTLYYIIGARIER